MSSDVNKTLNRRYSFTLGFEKINQLEIKKQRKKY